MIEVHVCADEADELSSQEIYNAVWPHDALTIDDANSFKASVRDWIDCLAIIDGAPVGSGFAALTPHRPEVVLALVTVLHEHRRHGAGSALYRALSEWTAGHGLGKLESPVEEDDAESIAFAERRGFAEVERSLRMLLDLGSIEPPEIDPPPGIEIVTWAERPELARGIYDVAVETYPDIPGQADDELESFDDWLEHDMRGSGDLPEATFVAVAGDEVVGYSKFSLTAAQPKVAHHDLTGVKRTWRRRGIAGSLKRAQIAWAKKAGYEQLATSNETRNTPIQRVNERLGYRPAPGRILFRGPLVREDSS
ncbi:MAG: GNAT family N-acetyltransferase [Actinomycetota bacterium]|nr:GNAT family N-acetyltransferase [Actinomycetota bacterium]